MKNIILICFLIFINCNVLFADSDQKFPWPYYNEYQFKNNGIGWFYSEGCNGGCDLRLDPSGRGHIDNWGFKDSFSENLIKWRNKNWKKYYYRYYFDWRIENKICYDKINVPEPNSLIILSIMGILIVKK